jgi:hypothetical protein
VAAFGAIIWLGTRFKASNSWWKLLGGGTAGRAAFLSRYQYSVVDF